LKTAVLIENPLVSCYILGSPPQNKIQMLRIPMTRRMNHMLHVLTRQRR